MIRGRVEQKKTKMALLLSQIRAIQYTGPFIRVSSSKSRIIGRPTKAA